LCSKSSNNGRKEFIPVGRVSGHRGRDGEMTVRVADGEAAEWTATTRFWIGAEESGGEFHTVESSRAYRDRLVLKLRGIDDGNAAAELRGRRVAAAPEDAPRLKEGTYYRAQLVGLLAQDELGTDLGTVADVVPTNGHDLLRITAGLESNETEDELLVPWVPELVLEVDLAGGRIRLRLPPGLRELNRK